MLQKKITFDSFIRSVLWVIGFVGLFFLFQRLSDVLLPFFIAWLVAYFIYPLVRFYQYKLRLKSRVLSIFCALLTIILIGVAISILIIPPMLEEFWRVKDLIVTYFIDGVQSTAIPKNISHFINQYLDIKSVTKILSYENIMNTLKTTVPQLWTLLTESVNLIFSILASFIILLYIVFILLDYESIAEGWIHLLPEKYKGFTYNLVKDLQVGMNKYFRGQALVSLCVAILYCIGFTIIDFPLAIGLGIFIGVLNLVPYLHVIALIPTVLLAILKAADTGGNFWWILVSALAVFAIIQTIQDTFIVPKIMGKITGLNPAIILLSLSIWGSLLGILGMIIALPLTTLMLSYYQRYIINHESIKSDEPKPADSQCLEAKGDK